MTSHSPDFATQVRGHGYRFTPQRQMILDAIRDSGGHTTPEEIYQRIHARSPAINRATIYRNVDFLCEVNLLVAAQIGGQMFYELAGAEPHHHLICRQCNAVDQINHLAVKELFDKIEHEQSFYIDMKHLALFGLCRSCQRAKLKVKRNAKTHRRD